MLLEKVRVALNYIKEEGLENVFKRHNLLARAIRAAVQAIVLSMVAPDNPADSATGFFLPEGMDGKKLFKTIRDEFGVTMAVGQDKWAGKVSFRIC